jgi:hypothetical protein
MDDIIKTENNYNNNYKNSNNIFSNIDENITKKNYVFENLFNNFDIVGLDNEINYDNYFYSIDKHIPYKKNPERKKAFYKYFLKKQLRTNKFIRTMEPRESIALKRKRNVGGTFVKNEQTFKIMREYEFIDRNLNSEHFNVDFKILNTIITVKYIKYYDNDNVICGIFKQDIIIKKNNNDKNKYYFKINSVHEIDEKYNYSYLIYCATDKSIKILTYKYLKN